MRMRCLSAKANLRGAQVKAAPVAGGSQQAARKAQARGASGE
jgi:hypothetical protein